MRLIESLRFIKARPASCAALALYCALLVCVTTGLMLGGQAALAGADRALDEMATPDIMLYGSFGFDSAQTDKLSALTGVSRATPVVYAADCAIFRLPSGSVLTGGRLPVDESECVVTAELSGRNTITVTAPGAGGDAVLSVVGVVQTPAAYAHIAGGAAFTPTLRYASNRLTGENGTCDAIAITLGTVGLSRFSDEYAARMDKATADIAALLDDMMQTAAQNAAADAQNMRDTARSDLDAAIKRINEAISALNRHSSDAELQKTVIAETANAHLQAKAALAEIETLLAHAKDMHNELVAQYDDYVASTSDYNQRRWHEFRNRRNKYTEDAANFRKENPGMPLPDDLENERLAVNELQLSCISADDAFDREKARYENDIASSQSVLDAYEANRQSAAEHADSIKQKLTDDEAALALIEAAISGVNRESGEAEAAKADAEARIAGADERERALAGTLWQIGTVMAQAQYTAAISDAAAKAALLWPIFGFGGLGLCALAMTVARRARLSRPDEERARFAIGAPASGAKLALSCLICAAAGSAVGVCGSFALACAAGPFAIADVMAAAAIRPPAAIIPCAAALLITAPLCGLGAALAERPMPKPMIIIDETAVPSFLRKRRGVLERRAFISARRDAGHLLGLFLVTFSITGIAVTAVCAFAAHSLYGMVTMALALPALIFMSFALPDARRMARAREYAVLMAVGLDAGKAASLLMEGCSAPIAAAAVFAVALSLAICPKLSGVVPAAVWPAACLAPLMIWLLTLLFARTQTSGLFMAGRVFHRPRS